MSRWANMPRAYRRQMEAQDREKVERITRTQEQRLDQGSAGRLRGIPAIGRGCPGHIRDTDPGGNLLRNAKG
jgi:hypothetical protein